MDIVARECRFVTGRTTANGGAGDSSVLTALGVMPSLAVLFVFGAHTTGELVPNQAMALVIDAVIFAACGGFAIRHFGLLSLPSSDVVPEVVTVP